MSNLADCIKKTLYDDADIIFCFKITLSNQRKLYLTSHQKEIIDAGTTYLPNSGLKLQKAVLDDSAQNVIEVAGIFESSGITGDDPLTDAAVEIYLTTITAESLCHLFTYYCTKMEKDNLSFCMYLEPVSNKFNRTITEIYSPTCRAEFADSRCKIDKTKYTKRFSVTSVDAAIVTLDTCTEYDYTNGVAIVTYDNCIFNAKITRHLKNVIALDRPIPSHITEIKTVLLTLGCDKKFATCCNKFDNAVNFRGEPFIPESKQFTKYAQ